MSKPLAELPGYEEAKLRGKGRYRLDSARRWARAWKLAAKQALKDMRFHWHAYQGDKYRMETRITELEEALRYVIETREIVCLHPPTESEEPFCAACRAREVLDG